MKVYCLFLVGLICAFNVRAQVNQGTTNCELANGYLNLAMSGASRDEFLIIIARLGKTEYNQELNKRRLYNIRMYLTKYNNDSFYAKNPQNVIYAVGEHAEGLGVIELYFKGRLLGKIFMANDRDLYIGECAVDLEIYNSACDIPDQKIFYPCRGKENKRIKRNP